MASFPPIADIAGRCDEVDVRTVRRPWLIFGILLACGIIGFTVNADWSAQSWLDLADYAVSIVAIIAVFIYAFDRQVAGATFWRMFRWVFVGVAAAQACVRAVEVAKRHGYSLAGTVGFVVMAAVVLGWIFVLQWVAMTRLANEQ
jgi:hypothetical protein